MTIIAAVVYRDGYLIGSDSRTVSKGELCFREKCFRSKNVIGVCTGRFILPGGDFSVLDDMFDDISDGRNFSHVEVLAESSYQMFVARRKPLELYHVSNREGRNNDARRLHLFEVSNRAESWMCAFGQRAETANNWVWTRSGAKGLLEDLLAAQILAPSDYDPGRPWIYRVTDKGIRRLPL